MSRLTTHKKVEEMSMMELAHNCCYADGKRNARYRDYNLDIDSRQLARNLMKDICNVDLTDLSDEEFEEYMGYMLQYEIDSTVGLLAVFYRNLWAMAGLREKLQAYEDLDEIGYLTWTPVTEKAPSESYNVPNLLLSFSDQYIVMAGRYEIDKDGEGHFYLRNEKTPCESKGLHVNAWLKMLPPYEELVSVSKNFDVRR